MKRTITISLAMAALIAAAVFLGAWVMARMICHWVVIASGWIPF
jgi:hypothetical protein